VGLLLPGLRSARSEEREGKGGAESYFGKLKGLGFLCFFEDFGENAARV
jgi:hypothetical protein